MRNKLKAAEDLDRVPIDRYLSTLPSPQKDICLSIRALLKRLHVDVREGLKWGFPCYTFRGRRVASMVPVKSGVNLTLFRGADLDDPDGIIEDSGTETRYLALHSPHEVRQPSVLHVVQQAVELAAQADTEFAGTGAAK